MVNKDKMQMIPNLESLADTKTCLEVTAMLGNDFAEINDMHLNGGYSFMNALLSKVSLNAEISISPDLPDKAKLVFAPILGMRDQEADMIFNLVKVYQKLDLHFQFNSTE